MTVYESVFASGEYATLWTFDPEFGVEVHSRGVRIVRCKDCKLATIAEDGDLECRELQRPVGDYDFCIWGEAE